MDPIEMVVNATERSSYTAIDREYQRNRTRQLASVAGMIVLGVCALLVLVGNAKFSDDDSVMNAMSLSERKAALRSVIARSSMLDEAFDKENDHAYVAALQPFLKSKDASEIKWVKAFDPKALSGEVKSYSDDISNILKGVDDEGKLLQKFTKPDV